MSSELRLKARKALRREVRRMKLRLYLFQFQLKLRFVLLKAQYAFLKLVGDLNRFLVNKTFR